MQNQAPVNGGRAVAILDFVLRNLPGLVASLTVVAALAWLLSHADTLRPYDSGNVQYEVGPAGAVVLGTGSVLTTVSVVVINLLKRLSKGFPHSLRITTRRLVISAVLFTSLSAILSLPPVRNRTKTIGLEVLETACARPGNTRLLLFIHGWTGGDTTWRDFPKLVCNDERLKTVDVVQMNYPTFMTQRDANVTALADALLRQLDAQELLMRHDRVASISHSMGGLIARSIVIADAIGGVQRFGYLVDVATPHQGATLSALAKVLGVGIKQVADMEPQSSFLQTLFTNWGRIDRQRRPETWCFTSPDDFVVSEDSAQAHCDGGTNYRQWGHIAMVKPSGASDDRYVLPVGQIRAFLTNSKPSVP
jgi:pimeloyl-ACP methyl ester carboxylesterase